MQRIALRSGCPARAQAQRRPREREEAEAEEDCDLEGLGLASASLMAGGRGRGGAGQLGGAPAGARGGLGKGTPPRAARAADVFTVHGG
jgi:hypothetical protein